MRRFKSVPIQELYMIRNGLETQASYYFLLEDVVVGIHSEYVQLVSDINSEIEKKENE